MSRSRATLIAASLLAIHAGLLAWSGHRHSPTLDEVGHLPAGLAIWQLGRFDLYKVNPPLTRAVAAAPVALVPHETDWSKLSNAPGARPEWAIGADFIRANGERSFWLFALARWTCIPFSLIGGVVCWRWARALFGESAGLVALALWCFCPSIIGNGSMITPDVPAAALGALAAFRFWRWLRTPTWTTALIAGVTLGLAELAKTTWIILFGLWPVIWLICRWAMRRSEVGSQRSEALIGRRPLTLSPPPSALADQPSTINHQPFTQLAAILLTGLYVLNLGYGFDDSFRRLDSFPFFSRTLSGQTRDRNAEAPGNRFSGTWLGAVPVPLPYDYLTGLDIQKQDFEIGKSSYLRGEFRYGGWWYYYLYAFLVKTPLGTLLLVPLAMLIALRQSPRLALVDSLPLIIPPLAVFVLVSSQTGFNRYFRYVVPALPFLYIALSRVALLFNRSPNPLAVSRPALCTARCIAATLLIWSFASSLYYWPHSLSYFNELAGGPRRGHEHLIDANIDWGQDLLYLREWIAAHPEARPLTVTYDGFFDPAVAGVEFPRTPALPPDDARPEIIDQLQPGWHAVSINYLRHPSRMYDYLLHFEPVATAGYSIYIYHLTAEDIAQIRDQRNATVSE